MWRCHGRCRNQVPYFGFIWLKEDREPNSEDLMWCADCEHDFERFSNDPLSEWECVTIFNRFIIENKFQIKSHQICPNDYNDADSFTIVPMKEAINDEQYVNYDEATGTFISIQDFYPHLYANLNEESNTVCMICFGSVAKENVIEHLNNCSGLTSFSYSQPELPILMINKLNQN